MQHEDTINCLKTSVKVLFLEKITQMCLPATLVVCKIKLEDNDTSESAGHRVNNKELLKGKQHSKTRFMLNMKN